jgi:hypothetical protein
MKKFQQNALRLFLVHDHLSLFRVGVLCLLMSLVLLSWYGATPGNAFGASQTKRPLSSSAPDAQGYPVKVYFPKHVSQSLEYTSEVFPVQRISPTKAVATYALQLLIAGPTLEEQEAGYYSDLNGMLQGASKCGSDYYGGPDFRLMLDRRGRFVEAGTATVQFCRQIIGIGSLSDGIVREQISKTLEQFPTIKKVLILMMDGRCFQAESLVGKYCESYLPG